MATTDLRSGLQYRLTDTGLAELSLAPIAAEWAPGRKITVEGSHRDKTIALSRVKRARGPRRMRPFQDWRLF